jgi:hypothetical protein
MMGGREGRGSGKKLPLNLKYSGLREEEKTKRRINRERRRKVTL